MADSHEQHLMTMAEKTMAAWFSADASSVQVYPEDGFAFLESGRLFRSDFRRFLTFLRTLNGDTQYRMNRILWFIRNDSVHYRVHVSSVRSSHRPDFTLRFQIHFNQGDLPSGLSLRYRPDRVIGCLSKSRVQAFIRRWLYAFRLYSL